MTYEQRLSQKAHLKHFECEMARRKHQDDKICAECAADLINTAPVARPALDEADYH